MSIPLYAEYTAETLEGVARQVAERRARELAAFREGKRPQGKYTLLRWTMEELPGTIWRNAYTFVAHTVKTIAENRFGKVGPDPDEWTNSMFEIGLWRGDRFCIEHWIRVDHLPAEVQQAWAIERVAYCREQMKKAQQDYKDAKTGTKLYSSPSYQKRHLAHEHADLAEARRELADLTERLGLTLSLDIRNVGVCTGDQLILL